MKSLKNKWIIIAFITVIISLMVWWHFLKVESQTVSIATIVAIDRDNKVVEIQSEQSPSIKVSYKKDLDVDIGRDYLIVYNHYKFRDPILVSIKE